MGDCESDSWGNFNHITLLLSVYMARSGLDLHFFMWRYMPGVLLTKLECILKFKRLEVVSIYNLPVRNIITFKGTYNLFLIEAFAYWII